MSEFSRWRGNEGYGVCVDEGRIEGELKQKLMDLRN